MNDSIGVQSQCYIGLINNNPCVFIVIIHFPCIIKNYKKVSRLVVLPDYQGIGIGNKFMEFIGNYYKQQKYRFIITTSTPALLNYFNKSNKWKLKFSGRCRKNSMIQLQKTSSINRLVTSWELI